MTYPLQSLRSGQLGIRQDSPMREDDCVVQHESVIHGRDHQDLPTPSSDVPPSLTTAVSRENSRYISFRPDDSAPVPMSTSNGSHRNPGDSRQDYSSSALPSQHGQAPAEQATQDQERGHHLQNSSTPSDRKRGRSENANANDNAAEANSVGDAAQSAKRRMTASISGAFTSLNRNNHTSSDSADSDLEPATAANNRRAPSPIYRAGRGAPPPPPSRESEDALARSLQATLGTRTEDDGNRQRTESTSHDGESHDGQQTIIYSSDPLQQAENPESRKRKRNFSNRTKTGCHTCRLRKKKCDEGKPTCDNCKRGGFECGGYGPKPPGSSKANSVRSGAYPSQTSHPYDYGYRPSHYIEHRSIPVLPPPPPPVPHLPPRDPGATGHYPGPQWDFPRPGVYVGHPHGYGPSPSLHLDQRSSEGWGARGGWPISEPPTSAIRDRLPPVNFSDTTTTEGSQRSSPGSSHQRSRPPVRTTSHQSASAGRSRHPALPIFMHGPLNSDSERMKMLSGKPYKHYIDDQLLHERLWCKTAVESFNEANKSSSRASQPEKERLFKTILDPSARDTKLEGFVFIDNSWKGPIGTCGLRTIVDAPFHCEFGYNIKLGNNVVIASNCLIEDVGLVTIGDNTVIGKNVSFHCMTASVDANNRGGSQGTFIAGSIVVEKNCFIGAGSTILPYRTIGEGSVVGAGSVVTRDVKPYTVVAGNPAKPIRKRKIESGGDVDRHDEDIQEENEKMLEIMNRRTFGGEWMP